MSAGDGILIIDDHPLFRKGIAELIAMAPHLQVVGEASGGEVGVEMAKTLDPDLILLDLHMKGMGGIEALKAIRDADLDCRVVILTVSDNADDLVAAIRNGRRAIGVDIDERWVAASIERLEAEDRHSSLGDVKRGQEALFDFDTSESGAV